MKKLLLLSGLAAGLLAAGPAAAQYYLTPFVNAGQNPGNLNNDLEQPTQPGWTNILTGSAATYTAPVWTPNQAIPFAFQFNGQAVTNYKVSSSGVLTFDVAATTVPSSANVALPSAQIPDKSVCAWGLAAKAGDYILTKTFGTAPNRQHWIQFNSYSVPANSNVAYTYWGIVLEETSNRIYVVDQRLGQPATAPTLGLTVGVQTNATTALQLPASPNVRSTTAATDSPTPSDNSYYRFSPGTPLVRDLAAQSLTIPSLVGRNTAVPVSGNLRNLGTQAVTSYTINYSVNNGTAVPGNVTGTNILPGAAASFTHPTPWQPNANGNYNLKVWLSNPNGQPDQDPNNDTIRTTVQVVDSTMRRKVVEESFTSSTCNPCRPGNANVENVNRANPGKYVAIRYQQNFPAPGTDPYASAESIARRNYYGINSIPRMMLDGGWNDNSNSFTSAILNQFQSKPSVMRVGGTYTLTGRNTVTMDAFVRPFMSFPAGRLVAHMVITERRTVLNARTNGETVFHDVMKKMMPNQNGTPLPALTSGQNFSLSQSFDVSTLPRTQAVENFDSLRVVVFVQDVVTKEIYQGEYMTLSRTLAARNAHNGPAFSLAPNPATGRTTLFVTPAHATQGRVDVLDMLGRSVFVRENVLLNAGGQQIDLDLSRQAAGLYTVRLATGEGVSTSKLTLE